MRTYSKLIRAAGIFLLTAAILCGLGLSAFADDLDLSHLGAVSVTPYNEEGEPVAVNDGSMTLYHVADIVEENNGTYGYEYTEDFKDCGIALDVTDPDMAQAAADYAEENAVTGWEKHFAGSDTVTFNGLSVGLYLIVQTETSTGMDPIESFLVSVPLYEDGIWQYDVDATPKVVLIPSTAVEVTPTPAAAPTETPETTPTEGEEVTPTPEVTETPKGTETPAEGEEVTPTPESSSSPIPVPGTEETPGPEDETEATPTPVPEDETESTPSPEIPVTDTTTTGGTGTTSGGGGTTTTTETLPQTGQLYWPVFLFGGLGIFLVALGLVIRFTGRRGRREYIA